MFVSFIYHPRSGDRVVALGRGARGIEWSSGCRHLLHELPAMAVYAACPGAHFRGEVCRLAGDLSGLGLVEAAWDDNGVVRIVPAAGTVYAAGFNMPAVKLFLEAMEGLYPAGTPEGEIIRQAVSEYRWQLYRGALWGQLALERDRDMGVIRPVPSESAPIRQELDGVFVRSEERTKCATDGMETIRQVRVAYFFESGQDAPIQQVVFPSAWEGKLRLGEALYGVEHQLDPLPTDGEYFLDGGQWPTSWQPAHTEPGYQPIRQTPPEAEFVPIQFVGEED